MGDAGEEGAVDVDVGEVMREFFEVGVEEGFDIFGASLDVAGVEEAVGDAGVGGTGEVDGGHVIGMDAEGIAEGRGNGAAPGALGVEQGAVDVEEEETGGV